MFFGVFIGRSPFLYLRRRAPYRSRSCVVALITGSLQPAVYADRLVNYVGTRILNGYAIVCGRSFAIVRGNEKPAAISHTKPGNRVSGMSGSAFGKRMSSQLSSPTTAISTPVTASHFGRNLPK